MKKYKIGFWDYFLFTALCVTVPGGCKKWVEVGTPATQLSTEVIFSGDQNATAALMGMYSRAVTNPGMILNGGNSICAGLSADEFIPTAPAAAYLEFSNNSLGGGNIFISTLYASAYNTIYNANTLLESLPHSTAVTAVVRRQITGEAFFMRGLVYSRLADLYGDVPLETGTNADVNATMGRTASETVSLQVLKDLAAADSLLGPAYAIAASAQVGERTRPNKWAARALLARVHLYRKEWAAAEAGASAVIGSGAYQLEHSLDSVFLAGSREAIWQLQPVSALTNSAEGYFFLPPDNPQSRPAYTLTSFLLNAFEPGDSRRQHWVGLRTLGGVNYYYPAKYKVHTGAPYTEYGMVLRLAEIYLIRAEARAQQNELAGAVSDLDTLRGRAGLPPLATDLGQDAVLAAVARERRVELFAEWGHRWSDLRRTGMADGILDGEKPGWEANDALYPIPLGEIQRNAQIKQNPGYQ